MAASTSITCLHLIATIGHLLQCCSTLYWFYKNELQNVYLYELTLGILRSEPGLTFIFTFVMAEIGFKTKSQTKKWYASKMNVLINEGTKE